MENKTFIIAELSANHNHDIEIARKTIKAMAESGADAVKIQTYTPDSLVMDVDNEFFGPLKTGLWKGIKRYDLYKEGSLPYEWQPELKTYAESLGLTFFSTPFDLDGVDFLESMNVPIYKIASFEINDIPLIRKVAQKHKPIIMSTGLASKEDIRLALQTCYDEGSHDVSLLKCTSEYPAKLSQANLLTIKDMMTEFGVRVGVSDHTMGSIVPMAAVAMGASIIEKHFILDRSIGGPDASFSMLPEEFRQMVDAVRQVEDCMGTILYNDDPSQHARRRGLYATCDIHKGDKFTIDNVKSFRPGAGLSPKHFDVLITKYSTREIKKGDPIKETDII